MTEKSTSRSMLKQMRLLAWLLVALAVIGIVALTLIVSERSRTQDARAGLVKTSFGGPFTLVGADGKPFSSQMLAGKPYAMYFGFTRCGDVCPTTLSRMVKLRREASTDQSYHILFVTIDPANDGPREVGQYASLFNAPVIGLTGSEPQIQQVKRQFGIYAQPVPDAPMGKQMEHSAIVLLFDRDGRFAGTISPDEPDEDALAKIRKLVA